MSYLSYVATLLTRAEYSIVSPTSKTLPSFKTDSEQN